MSLILDPATWDEVRLVEMLASLREDLSGTLESLEGPRAESMEAASRRTAVDLVRDVIALAEAAAVPPLDKTRLVAVVNVEYDAMLAAIDLLKSHSDLPKVPRGRSSAG